MVSSNVRAGKPSTQDVCIDLPGETVQCWRSSDKIRVVLRKHRDVIFDIALQSGALYTVESKGEFYNPLLKKLGRTADFMDGEQFHLWIGREFKEKLILKMNGRVIGSYEVSQLDGTSYGKDPRSKPEPLMIVMGKKEKSTPWICTPEDNFGVRAAQSAIMAPEEPKLSILKGLGTKFEYSYLQQLPEMQEYVAVTEASSDEIQPHVLAKLESGHAVDGVANEIFLPPKNKEPSLLYTALIKTAQHISGNQFLTNNGFKETAGYFVEHFSKLNRVAMKVHIEPKAKGKYNVALKGYLLTDTYGKITGSIKKPRHFNNPLGSKETAFLDGGFGRTGKAGFGGFKRIIMTCAENFKGGVKIQAIGTIIDLIVDVNAVYLDEKGSKDLSEFLGRAGVSLAKAGATAALGSAFAALGTAGLGLLLGTGAAPVFAVVAVIVVGYIIAAMVVDAVDEKLNIKGNVAEWAR